MPRAKVKKPGEGNADSRAMISAAILAVRERYLMDGLCKELSEINSGLCDDFAKDVMLELGGLDTPLVSDVSVASFQVVDEDCEFEDGRPFDLDLLKAHWPEVVPPKGLSWRRLNKLAEGAGFGNGTHVWLTDGELHYDAERPEGVANFFDLPFFERVIASWQAERSEERRASAPRM